MALTPRRVFIAGSSAGGAMAAIVAAAYPDIFVGAGVHSGIPIGAAGNVAEAFMVMKSGELGIVMPGKGRHLGPPACSTVTRTPRCTRAMASG